MAIVSLILVKATLVVGVAWVATLAARRASAATRAAVWWAALAMLLALPLGAVLLPAWTPVPAALRPPPDAALAIVAQPRATPVPSVGHDGHARYPMVSLPRPRRGVESTIQAAALRAEPWLIGLWLVGAVGALVGLLLGVRRSHSLRRTAVPAPVPITNLAIRAARRLGLVRVPPIVLCPELTVPAQGGIVRPAVLLPADAVEWPHDRLSVVLLHELAHVARRDLLVHLLGRLVVALYWLNPLVHVAFRRAALETERACDDAVLRAGTPEAEYAAHLAAVAALLGGVRTGAALAMARPSTLLVRVRAILDGRSNRRAATRRFTLATACGAGLLALLVGASTPAGDEGRHLVAALDANAPAMRRAAAWRLGELRRRSGAAALERRLGDPDPGVRSVAAWSLGRLRARDAVPALIALAGDPDPHVREMTALALGTIGDARATAALAALAADRDWSVRAVTTRALRLLGTDEAAAILAHRTAVEPDEHARSMAVWELQEINTAATRDGLLRALAHPSPVTRHDALATLKRLGDPATQDAIAHVLARDSVANVRAHAAAVLCELGDEAVVPALVVALRDANWHVRAAAICGLGRLGGPAAAAALLDALSDDVHQVRLSAVEALNRVGEP